MSEILIASIDVVQEFDTAAPVVAVQFPKKGSDQYTDRLQFLIVESPQTPYNGLSIPSLSVDVDTASWVSNGRANEHYCSISVKEFTDNSQLRVTVYPNKAFAYGEHSVAIRIADLSGNTMHHSFVFTQSLAAEFERYSLETTELEDALISRKSDTSSWDLKLKRSCTHLLVRELHFIENDLVTIRMERAVATIAELQVHVNSRLVDREDPKNGFAVVYDNRSVAPYRKHKLVFNRSFRSDTDIVELTYSTYQNTCPRCHTLGYLDDIAFIDRNSMEVVDGHAKLRQEIEKIVLTTLGSNFRYAWYGTMLIASIGAKTSAVPEIQASFIRMQVQDALKRLMDIKKEQAAIQTVSDEERIENVDRIEVRPVDADPTAFEVEVVVQVVKGSKIEIVAGMESSGFSHRSF